MSQKIVAELGWNTGRLYQKDGQRVSAHRAEDGSILFNDHSRGIAGVITDPDAALNARSIQRAYDAGCYSYDGRAGWIEAEAFPKVYL